MLEKKTIFLSSLAPSSLLRFMRARDTKPRNALRTPGHQSQCDIACKLLDLLLTRHLAETRQQRNVVNKRMPRAQQP